jgi:hypothetical protein
MWRVAGLGVWLVAAGPLAAQWSVGAEVGMLRFWGASADTLAPSDPASARPSPSTAYAVRVQRRFGAAGVAIGLLYSPGGVGVENGSVAVEEKGAVKLHEVAPEASVRVAKPGPGGALCLHVGPVIDRWSPTHEPRRTRIGARAAVSLNWPLAGALIGTFAAGVALSSSMFLDDEVPEGYVLRAMWRRALSAGIQWRL